MRSNVKAACRCGLSPAINTLKSFWMSHHRGAGATEAMSLLESAVINCPYCGERNELLIDTSVPEQEYIEDCFVCCRPMVVSSRVDDDGALWVSVRTDEEV